MSLNSQHDYWERLRRQEEERERQLMLPFIPSSGHKGPCPHCGRCPQCGHRTHPPIVPSEWYGSWKDRPIGAGGGTFLTTWA
jgi:hypothetical protein